MRDMSFLDRPDKDTVMAVRQDIVEDAPKIAQDIMLAEIDKDGDDDGQHDGEEEKRTQAEESPSESRVLLNGAPKGATQSIDDKQISAESRHAALTKSVLEAERAVVDSADDAIRTWMGLEASGNPLLLHELLLETNAQGRAKPWGEYNLDGFLCVRDRLAADKRVFEHKRAATEERIQQRKHRELLSGCVWCTCCLASS